MNKTTPQFDFEEALEALKAGRDLNGKDGILTPLIKQLTEAALAAELEQHIKSGDENQGQVANQEKISVCLSLCQSRSV